MPALSVIDLAMFLLETPERPFNIGPLIVLDPPAKSAAGFADKLHARMLKRPVGPPFSYRLRTPLLGVPSLEEDPDTDVAAHVHRLTLKPPGSHEQLFAEVCKLHETRLDRSRMLWELYVIDGLEGGKVAVYAKAHHGIIDGRGFVQAVSAWLAESPADRGVRAMWEALPKRSHESAERVSLADKVRKALGKSVGTAGSMVSLYRMLGEQGLHKLGLGGKDAMALPFTGIPGAFTGTASPERALAYCALPLAEMKAFGKRHDAKVNDLLLATLDIALHRYLAERGSAAKQALIAAMPVALANAGGGNQIAVLQFPLGAPGKSPAERLAAIRAETAKVKAAVGKTSSETVMLFTTLVHGLPALLEKAGLKRGLAVSNLIVSNPFGLAEPRYLMGAPVEMVMPVSVVAAGQMLNITAVTLAGKLQIGFLGTPKAVPEIGKLAQYTAEAFAELTGQPPAAGPAKAVKRVRAAAKPVAATTKAPRKPAAPAARKAKKAAAPSKGIPPAQNRRRAAAG